MEKIGFIGLGIMGKPMALNLLKAGYPVQILESSSACGELVNAGAKAFPDAGTLAGESDIVITMLPDSPEVEDMVMGSNGIADGIGKGSLFIDMSTISPSTAKKLYELMQKKGVEALDAPVSGGQVGAESGSLSIMVGGSEKAFQRAEPLFGILGKSAVLIGGPGAGQMTKACNQMIVGATIQAVAEAFTLAKKAGVDLVKMRKALLGGFAQSRILDLHGQRIIDQNFNPGFRVSLHRKDMNIALQAGREHAVPLYSSALVAAQMDSLLAQGMGDADHSALSALMDQMAGVDKE